jgi:hypothetical protein
VDFSAEFLRGIESGSSDAVYAVFSIVNTLAGNFAEIQKVKILIEGDEAEDVGGHLDLSRPILPEMGLVSAAPPGSAAPPASAPPAPSGAEKEGAETQGAAKRGTENQGAPENTIPQTPALDR